MSLEAETTRHLCKKSLKNIGCYWKNVGPNPFNGFQEMKHNSAITCQNQLEFSGKKFKDDFSWQCKNFFGYWVNIFGPRPLDVKSLKDSLDRQSLIDNQNFDIANHIST